MRVTTRVLRETRATYQGLYQQARYRLQIQSLSGLVPFKDITELLGNHSVLDPPDPIPNSEVKRYCADDSVGSPHVKVGHCQAFIPKPRYFIVSGFFYARNDFLPLGVVRSSFSDSGCFSQFRRSGSRCCGTGDRPIDTARDSRLPVALWIGSGIDWQRVHRRPVVPGLGGG